MPLIKVHDNEVLGRFWVIAVGRHLTKAGLCTGTKRFGPGIADKNDKPLTGRWLAT